MKGEGEKGEEAEEGILQDWEWEKVQGRGSTEVEYMQR